VTNDVFILFTCTNSVVIFTPAISSIICCFPYECPSCLIHPYFVIASRSSASCRNFSICSPGWEVEDDHNKPNNGECLCVARVPKYKFGRYVPHSKQTNHRRKKKILIKL
jgi:hypothetical protein